MMGLIREKLIELLSFFREKKALTILDKSEVKRLALLYAIATKKRYCRYMLPILDNYITLRVSERGRGREDLIKTVTQTVVTPVTTERPRTEQRKTRLV